MYFYFLNNLKNHNLFRPLFFKIYSQPLSSLPLQVPGHQSVFINEPRLSDFKQVLLREGIQAEFVGGVLVCNNMVAVRRVSVLPTGLERTLFISSLQQMSPLALNWEYNQHRRHMELALSL